MIATRHADASVFEWLSDGLPEAGAPLDRAAFLARYAGLTRRLGNAPGGWRESEHKELSALGVLEPSVWSVADAARAGMLLIALDALPAEQHVAFATEIFRRGETAERVALLRSLAFLPEPTRFEKRSVGQNGNMTLIDDR